MGGGGRWGGGGGVIIIIHTFIVTRSTSVLAIFLNDCSTRGGDGNEGRSLVMVALGPSIPSLLTDITWNLYGLQYVASSSCRVNVYWWSRIPLTLMGSPLRSFRLVMITV